MAWRLRIQPGLLLVLVAVAVGAEADPPSQETFLDQCVDKSWGNNIKYICNDGEYETQLLEVIHLVTITCHKPKLDCSRFPTIDMGRNSTSNRLQVHRCELNEPISCFLAKLNISNVQDIDVSSLLPPLSARHFEGLQATADNVDTDSPSVQKLNLTEMVVSLPHLKGTKIIEAQLNITQAPLDASYNPSTDVPPGFFGDLPSLESLLLQNNYFVNINNDTFAGLDKLRYLHLFRNKISELRGGELSPLRRLERLSIEYNPLTRLHDGFLQGLDQLQRIDISSSEPLVLGPRAFADLRSLLYLLLQNSRIQELNGTVFQGSKFIHSLSLSENQLERLHPEVFRDQTEMTRLDLSKNRLVNIPGDLFKTLAKLETLDLSYNQLEYLPDNMFQSMLSLKIVSASHNKLKQISRSILFRLMSTEFADLSYNLIDDISNEGMIVRDFHLRSLQLSHNRLSKLPVPHVIVAPRRMISGWITEVVTVTTVDLSYNKISTVRSPLPLLEQDAPMKYILDHNPLICDCHIYSFAKLATFNNYSQYFSLEDARCNAPVRLKGTRLTQVPLDEFKCHVNCPSACNCTDVPNKDIVKALCSEVSTKPSNITKNVSLKFTRKPKSLQNLSFENVVEIDLSGLDLNEINFVTLPKNVKLLNLSDNNLNYLPNDVLKRNISFILSNNPLFCDCWNQEHVAELQQNRANIIEYLALRCEDDMLLSQVDVQRICDIWKLTIIGVSLIVCAVVFILLAVIIYRYSFEVKVYISKYFPYLLPEEKYDASKKFDVFISYAHQDEDFIRDMLLPKLEGPPINVKTCIHSRDWIAGEMIPYNIAKSVEESRRTVIVLSENFLKSIWGLLEFRTAHVQAIKEGKTRVVVILLEDVLNKEDLNKEIKAYLRTNTYIKWGEPWFWEKLAYALPKRGTVVDSREEKRLQAIANELAKTRLEMQQNNED